MSRTIFAVLAAGAAATLALAFRTHGTDAPSAWPVARAERRPIGAAIKATGVVKPRLGAEVRVGARTSGVVQRLHVRIGDPVTPGQLLAELDPAEPAARCAQATAALASARAALAYAALDLERTERLAGLRLVAEDDLDRLRRAQAVAAAAVAEAEAALQIARIQRAWTRILAPIPGVVASISTQEGETVAAGFAPSTFVTLLDLSRLEVRAYVDETDIGRIEVGRAASFTVDTYPAESFPGVVTLIHPQAEIRDNVVNYVAVVSFDPPSGRTLRPEMTAAVRIALAARAEALAVPRRAVRREGGRTFVLCPQDGADPLRRWVTTGTKDDTHCEVTSGLAAGDRVLLGDGEPAGP